MRQRILALLAEGKTYSHIVAEVGCAKSTVAYHAKNVKEPPNYKVHDWAAVQKCYDAGSSGLKCIARFGICRAVWYNANKRARSYCVRICLSLWKRLRWQAEMQGRIQKIVLDSSVGRTSHSG